MSNRIMYTLCSLDRLLKVVAQNWPFNSKKTATTGSAKSTQSPSPNCAAGHNADALRLAKLPAAIEIEDTNGDTIFLKKLTDLLNERLKENKISLPMVAQYFALSESGFKSKLKRVAGKTFLDFTREFRLKKSREHLITQQYNVSEVARITGFRSVAHFSDAFKRYFGVSPSNLLV